MPTANFETTVTLPHTDCTEDDVYELCRTLKPTSGLVDGTSLTVGTDGKITLGTASGYFHKFTKTFANLAQAGLTFDIELFQLPAAGAIQAIKLKHSAAFTGGAISAYTLSVGIGGNLTKYLPAKNVFAAPGAANFHIVWAPFFNYLLPASLPVGAAYSQTEITNIRNVLQSLFTGAIGSEDHQNPISIRLAAASTGANLSVATAGSVDVWVLYSILS